MPITFRNVIAGYREGKEVLRGISCELDPPVVILGPNGAGKTTLFRTILGLTPLLSGEILIDGTNVNDIRGSPGLVATNLDEVYRLLRLPVKDIASLYLNLIEGDFESFLNMTKEAGLSKRLNHTLDSLSSGERRMFLNLIALSSKAKYLLLDEPFENLDPRMRVWILKIILANQKRIIMNTHATWLLKRLEGWKAYLMVSGRIFGPLNAEVLPDLSIASGERRDSLLTIEVEDRKLSLTRGEGFRISDMDSLDRLYEVMYGE